MKKTLFFMFLTLLVILTQSLSKTLAQDYTQWGLPAGAIARLGKGEISGNLAYSPDGTRLAITSYTGIWIYDAQTGEALDFLKSHGSGVQWRTKREIDLLRAQGHSGRVLSVSFSPDGKTLASAGGFQWWLWNVETRQLKAKGHHDSIRRVRFSPGGKIFATGGGDHALRLWDTTTGQPTAIYWGHIRSVKDVSFSPDGKTLATGSEDGTVLLWNIVSATNTTDNVK